MRLLENISGGIFWEPDLTISPSRAYAWVRARE